MSASETVSVAVGSPVPLLFPQPDVVNGTPLHPVIGSLLLGFWVSLSCSGIWSGSMCKVYITLQELQAAALMLCKMAF